jgi:serine/threonine-protein kinase
LLWAFSLFAFRRFTTGALSLTTIALVALLSLFSITVQVQRGIWIETGDAIVYSLCISVGLLLQSLYRSWQIRTRMDADDARLELAQLHLEHNNPKSAADQLLLTSMSEDTADLLMEAGKAFERKRDYQSARDIYTAVHNYFPGYSQASDALDDISSITGQHPSLSSTLILPDMPVELPQLGRYELSRLLGKGAMGAVYLANDPTIRRQVAIKTLMLNELGDDREELRDRFLREAETAGRLQHPNIVTVYDVGEDGDLAYIAMDYVPGGTLADWTHADRLLELASLYEIMERTCDALGYAHQQGVIHRDIKPGNILYNPEDMSVKVTDFGIARLADYSRTKTGAIIGSPYYMSPEQVSGNKVGPSTDLYSLGVTFYQLLCGSLPFEADSLAQLAWQITNKPHRNIGKIRKGLPRSASRIINIALKKDPGERFANAAEMATAFQKGSKSLDKQALSG